MNKLDVLERKLDEFKDQDMVVWKELFPDMILVASCINEKWFSPTKIFKFIAFYEDYIMEFETGSPKLLYRGRVIDESRMIGLLDNPYFKWTILI